MNELPTSWVTAALQDVIRNPQQDIVDGPFGSNLKASEYQDSGIPIIRLQNVARNRFLKKNIKFITPKKADELRRHSFLAGDIAITKLGDPLGKAAIIPPILARGVIVADIVRLRVDNEFVDSRYLTYAINSPDVCDQLAEETKGTTRPRVNLGHIRSLQVPFAPLPEQKRIADKLDAVLARVDACRERLDRVPLILRRFRQAVLAAAISGKLTESWREDCNLSYEDWQKLSLGEIVREVKNGLSPKPNEKLPGTPILRISSVRPFSVSFTDIRYLPPGIPVESYLLQPDDLLFTRYNGTREFVGVCGRVKSLPSYPVVYPDKLIRVRSNKEQALAGFIEIATSAPSSREVIEELAKTSAGQTGISGKDLKGLRVTLPSLLEQHEIVRRVESLFAYADRLEARYNTARAQVERLTPALLAKAFRGELVPQDPNDEPASVLLERIRNGKGVGRNKRSISGDRDRRERHAAFSQLTRSE